MRAGRQGPQLVPGSLVDRRAHHASLQRCGDASRVSRRPPLPACSSHFSASCLQMSAPSSQPSIGARVGQRPQRQPDREADGRHLAPPPPLRPASRSCITCKALHQPRAPQLHDSAGAGGLNLFEGGGGGRTCRPPRAGQLAQQGCTPARRGARLGGQPSRRRPVAAVPPPASLPPCMRAPPLARPCGTCLAFPCRPDQPRVPPGRLCRRQLFRLPCVRPCALLLAAGPVGRARAGPGLGSHTEPAGPGADGPWPPQLLRGDAQAAQLAGRHDAAHAAGRPAAAAADAAPRGAALPGRTGVPSLGRGRRGVAPGGALYGL